MRSKWREKTLAVVCALILTAAVMFNPVITRADAVAAEETIELESSDIVFSGSSAEMSQIEVIDNRTTIPYFVGDVEYGVCMLIDGTPYVNVTEFLPALGLDCVSNGDGSSLVLSVGGITLTAEEGAVYFICNGRYLYVKSGVQVMDGEIWLPVEALMRCTGITVTWDRVEWIITVDESDLAFLTSGDDYYSETDVYWLSRVIYAEAGGQSLEAQAAIGSVIINRVLDETFPNTVYEVIFAKNQFDVVINGMVYMSPDDTAVIAAKLALEEYDFAAGATYFIRESSDVNDDSSSGESYVCVEQVEDLCFLIPA